MAIFREIWLTAICDYIMTSKGRFFADFGPNINNAYPCIIAIQENIQKCHHAYLCSGEVLCS